MTWELVIAALSLVSVLLRMYFKRRKEEDGKLIDLVIQHKVKESLSIAEAEKRDAENQKLADDVDAGRLSPDDLNRLRSGQKPLDR